MSRKRASDRDTGQLRAGYSGDTGRSPAQTAIRRKGAEFWAVCSEQLEHPWTDEERRARQRALGRVEGLAIAMAAIRGTSAKEELRLLKGEPDDA